MNIVFKIIDLDLYFLDFLDIATMLAYLRLSKQTYEVFKLSLYYKEIIEYRKEPIFLNFSKLCCYGHLNLLKLCFRDICQYYNKNSGNLRDFMYNYQNMQYKYNFGLISNIILTAIENDNFDIVSYLAEYKIEINFYINFTLKKLTEDKVIKILKILKSLGYDIINENYYITQTMASKGYIQALQYLISLGTDLSICDDYALQSAIYNCQLDTVKYLLTQYPKPIKISEYAYFMIKYYTNNEILTYLDEHKIKN